jgi:hypothetical protein
MKKTTVTIVLSSIILFSISANSFTISAVDKKSSIDDQKPTPVSSRVCEIYGKVLEISLDELIAPSAGATIHCKGMGLINKISPYDETRITDAEGNYSFENVPLHRWYLLYVEKEGYIPCFLPKPLTGFALIKIRFDFQVELWPSLLLIKKLSN